MTDRNVCVLGGGAMGTACAQVLAQQSATKVTLWVRNATFASHIAETRVNSRLLPGVELSPSVHVTADPRVIGDAGVVVVCVPTRSLRDAMTEHAERIDPGALMVSAIKGIEIETLTRPSEVIQSILGERPVVAFGGPCHAEEVACGKPASVVAASNDQQAAQIIQSLFSNQHLRVYSNTDLLGVELGGALKNVIAIAAGISDGLEFGDNAKSALITRGLAEMVRFGSALGASADTFYGLAGIGDLIATCGSRHSRNRHVGERLGRGQTLAEIRDGMQAVAEGVFTAKSIVGIATERGIEMPIAQEVYRVLFEDKSPREATMALMQRPLRGE